MLEGRVRRVEPAAYTKISALGVQEQRVNVIIDLTSPRELWSGLGDGYGVAVRIVTLSLAQALRVPVSAVFPLPAAHSAVAETATAASAVAVAERAPAAPTHAVFVFDGRAARLRPVQLGGRNGNEAWIQQGLDPGETVIVYPPAGVADGVRVQPRDG